MFNSLTREVYSIGFIKPANDADFVFNHTDSQQIEWVDLNGYKGGWFADPFILSANQDVIDVLVEEWVNKQGKGRISKLTIDAKSYKLLEVKPILENETHFSFPNIIKDNGKLYVYPENCEGGKLNIYEYDTNRDKLTNPCCLVNEPLLDSQLMVYDGKYYIFAINQNDGDMRHNILYIYESGSLMGNYKLIQVYKNERKEERGAGSIFLCDGQIVRPVQCCEGDYGVALIFNEIVYENGQFKEIELGRMFPNKQLRFNRKIHTYNRLGNIVVVDGNEFVHRHIASIYQNTLKNLIRR